MQAECKEGHCGGKHNCESEEECVGSQPHCHEGMEWPPPKDNVFQVTYRGHVEAILGTYYGILWNIMEWPPPKDNVF